MVDGIQEFIESIQNTYSEPSKTYRAEVSNIDNEGRVWVYLAGSDIETPTSVSSSEVNVGDNVNVEWRNNKLYIAGNVSNPSAGTIRVAVVEQAAQVANSLALEASASAQTARTAAESAVASAEQASSSATQAEQSAQEALSSATNATTFATNALNQLSVIENVVGVLELLSTHGTYTEIADEGAIAEEGKWYFTLEQDGSYKVADVSVGDSVTGYYELTDIDQAVTNYVSSHLALTSDGLSLQQDNSDYRILISTNGLKIIGTNGSTVAEYGTETVIGDTNGFHIRINGNELGFFNGGGVRIAYLNGQQLYITKSVVLQQMDLGTPYGYVDPVTAEVGKGQWSWKVHPNSENPPRNNLNLKWIG